MFPFFKKKKPAPEYIPGEAELKRWACGAWVEYQAWLFHHGFVTLHEWQMLRAAAQALAEPVRFSIVTPVYNPPPDYLAECIDSVRAQSYPHWELCLVDDGSRDEAIPTLLQEQAAADPRIKLQTSVQNQGICAATNLALEMAGGDYVAFLDHDDRLAPDALSRVAEVADADTDIVYTDRDMLSPENLRFMHLFKPDWSPETLLSGNYLFHLLVYRRTLLETLGGVRAGYEGSQDYDLILRAAETRPVVRHIPRVLYHWRQHRESVSLEHNSKDYAYSAGLRALREHLQRRGLAAEVEENPALWRGNYRVRFAPPPADTCRVLRPESLDHYAATLNQALADRAGATYLVVLGPGVAPADETAIAELTGWLQIPEVLMCSGKVTDGNGRLLHAGLVQNGGAAPVSLYQGHPETTPGYMAVTANARNVSLPHPACVAIFLAPLRELAQEYQGPHALWDCALKALSAGHRMVYNPFARFTADARWQDAPDWPPADAERFAAQWQGTPDPYYNPHLTLALNDMGLKTEMPIYGKHE